MRRVVIRSVGVEGDPAFMDGDGGTILAEFDDDRMWSVGDRVNLPNGDEVQVLGLRELLSGVDPRSVLCVGDVSKELRRTWTTRLRAERGACGESSSITPPR